MSATYSTSVTAYNLREVGICRSNLVNSEAFLISLDYGCTVSLGFNYPSGDQDPADLAAEAAAARKLARLLTEAADELDGHCEPPHVADGKTHPLEART